MSEEIDYDKIDDAVLALLYLTTSSDDCGHRAWKAHDWDVMERLHAKGLISNPVGKQKSVAVTEEGYAMSKALFEKMFSK